MVCHMLNMQQAVCGENAEVACDNDMYHYENK